MIDFAVVSKKLNNPFLEKWNRYSFSETQNVFIKDKHHHTFKKADQDLILIGDCINMHLIDSCERIDTDFIINKLKGNFYAILINNEETFLTSSAFGLLPVYYLDDFSVLSSSVTIIHELSTNKLTESKKWIVNQLLFNYQFFDDTFFNEIKLFPTMSVLKIDKRGKNSFHKYFHVKENIIQKPESWKKSIGKLSDLFIKLAEQYIPDDGSVISFTGGFDGRTLVSVATYFNKSFTTFSYGKKENDDVAIPLKHAKALDLPYFWINLDDEYSTNHYPGSAVNYIMNTGGSNGFLSAHADYAAQKIQEKGCYLVSGVCGSELFRAAHSSGAVTSKALLDLFSYDSYDEYKDTVQNSNVFKYLRKEEFKNEIEEVINKTWDYKNNLPDRLSKNQKLYVFVYEEIFRKFFGNGVSAQMKYINVRTPYIDFDFFKKLLKTELAGAYSDFLTENPLKRYKGQILYTDIIKKTNQQIYHLKTGKGYAPRIVRETLLRPLLFVPFFTKRIKRKTTKTNLDNLGIISGIKLFLSENDNLSDAELFNSKIVKDNLARLSPYTSEKDRDLLLKILSFSYLRKMIQNESVSN